MIDETDTLFIGVKKDSERYKNSYAYDKIYSVVKEWLVGKTDNISISLIDNFKVRFYKLLGKNHTYRIELSCEMPGYLRSTSFVYSMVKDFDPCDSISYLIFRRYEELLEDLSESVSISFEDYREVNNSFIMLKEEYSKVCEKLKKIKRRC